MSIKFNVKEVPIEMSNLSSNSEIPRTVYLLSIWNNCLNTYENKSAQKVCNNPEAIRLVQAGCMNNVTMA